MNQAWQLIETAPYETPVLVCEGDKQAVMYSVLVNENVVWLMCHVNGYEYQVDIENPTHWMSLPSTDLII